MNVLLMGATGKVGRPLLDELLDRGHRVTAVARSIAPLRPAHEALNPVRGDVFDAALLADLAAGADVVVCAVALRDPAQADRTPVDLVGRAGDAALGAGARLVTLGGAGSLRTASGVDLVDTPEFPEVARRESEGFRDALVYLRTSAPAELVWTMVCPPISIEVAGPRTGRYRSANNTLVTDGAGRSRISAADLAIAVVDEVEEGRHQRSRFTVGY